MEERTMHIGEVAERVGLSLRTIRYYEEVGLISPSARTPGGFRLYTDDDADRLQLVKDMKPLGFSLDEMRDLLAILDRLDEPGVDDGERVLMRERLGMYRVAADARCDALRGQLRIAESFARTLRRRHEDPPAPAAPAVRAVAPAVRAVVPAPDPTAASERRG